MELYRPVLVRGKKKTLKSQPVENMINLLTKMQTTGNRNSNNTSPFEEIADFERWIYSNPTVEKSNIQENAIGLIMTSNSLWHQSPCSWNCNAVICDYYNVLICCLSVPMDRTLIQTNIKCSGKYVIFIHKKGVYWYLLTDRMSTQNVP